MHEHTFSLRLGLELKGKQTSIFIQNWKKKETPLVNSALLIIVCIKYSSQLFRTPQTSNPFLSSHHSCYTFLNCLRYDIRERIIIRDFSTEKKICWTWCLIYKCFSHTTLQSFRKMIFEKFINCFLCFYLKCFSQVFSKLFPHENKYWKSF